MLQLSPGERRFVLDGAAANVRVDGRGRSDFRYFGLQRAMISHANGSARIRLGATDVLVAITAEIREFQVEEAEEAATGAVEGEGAERLEGGDAALALKRRGEGAIRCSVDAVPSAFADESQRVSSCRSLSSLYQSMLVASGWFDLSELDIVEGKHAWSIYLDAVLFMHDGNVLDALLLASKVALLATRLPSVRVIRRETESSSLSSSPSSGSGGEVELVVSDDPFESKALPVSNAPLSVTLQRLGSHWCVDGSRDEELCASLALVLAIDRGGSIVAMEKIGTGPLSMTAVQEAMEIAAEVAGKLHEQLEKSVSTLDREDDGSEALAAVGEVGQVKGHWAAAADTANAGAGTKDAMDEER